MSYLFLLYNWPGPKTWDKSNLRAKGHLLNPKICNINGNYIAFDMHKPQHQAKKQGKTSLEEPQDLKAQVQNQTREMKELNTYMSIFPPLDLGLSQWN